MGDQQRRFFLRPDDAADIRRYLQAGLIVQGAERFIQKKEFGLQRQRPDQRGTLFHAAGELAGAFVTKVPEAVVFQIIVYFSKFFGDAEMIDLEPQDHVFIDAAPLKEMVVLQHIADLRALVLFQHRKKDLSGFGGEESRDQR